MSLSLHIDSVADIPKTIPATLKRCLGSNFVDNDPTSLEGNFADQNIRPVTGQRIPIFMWNYYPEMGVFGPANYDEDGKVLALVDMLKMGLNPGQCLQLGEILAKALAVKGTVLGIVDGIERVYLGLGGRDPAMHPLVYMYYLQDRIQKGPEPTKGSQGISVKKSFDREAFQELLFFMQHPTIFTVNGTDAKGPMEMAIQVPNPFMLGSYIRSSGRDPAKYPDIYNIQRDPAFKADIEGGINGTKQVSPAIATANFRQNEGPPITTIEDARVVNIAEVVKGSPSTLLHTSEDSPTDVETLKNDIDTMTNEFINKGYVSDKFVKAIARKMGPTSDFKVTEAISKEMGNSVDPGIRDIRSGQIALQVLKYFDRILKELA